jgi:hypothetical protein
VTIASAAFIWITVSFYKCKDADMPVYITILSFLVLFAVVPLGLFVGVFSVKQTGLVLNGVTTKQYVSIMKEGSSVYREKQFSCLEKISNLYQFLKKKRADSLVNIRI